MDSNRGKVWFVRSACGLFGFHTKQPDAEIFFFPAWLVALQCERYGFSNADRYRDKVILVGEEGVCQDFRSEEVICLNEIQESFYRAIGPRKSRPYFITVN